MRLTAKAIYDKKKKKEKIVALTAYDFPSARILNEAGVDIVLVGDSLGMVLLGYESTVPVTMRQMLHHTRPVAKAVTRALVVADMPFGSYDTVDRALRNAKRFLKEGRAAAVKLEGGERIQKEIKALIGAGVPVMGHLGMTPQTANLLGGYRVQGKEKKEAEKIMREALLLDRLGVFALVLECIPSSLAERITRQVKCPTIGIGAGVKTDGQILVLHDMLGFKSDVHPRFVRQYAHLEAVIQKAVEVYRKDVLAGRFPAAKETY